MPGADSLRARLLDVVAGLGLVRDGSLRFPLAVEVRDAAGAIVRFEVASPAELRLDPLVGLSAYDRAIVEAATTEPVPRKKLAKLAGKKYIPYFHEHIRSLVERGILREDHRGVYRP